MGSGIARRRLAGERKSWTKKHPHGFVAKPEMGLDGAENLMVWHCTIPGKSGVSFFHPNVHSNGKVCLWVLDIIEYDEWRPAITVKQILESIQRLLDSPSYYVPAQQDGYYLFHEDPVEYKKRVKQQSKKYPPIV